jgi:5-methyltetrahydrofolate--homocysteine methyltransferase
MEELVNKIYNGVLEGKHKQVAVDVQAAIDQGTNPVLILNEGMIAAMAEVGRLFEVGEYYVPEMLISARAMQTGLAVLKPLLKEADVKPAGRVAIGTVKGDLHDIGKNLVSMMLEGAGFEIKDMGTDVSPEKFVDAVKGGGVDIVALSALLTTTMPNMKATIDATKQRG